MNPSPIQQSSNRDSNNSKLPAQWLFYLIAIIGVLISLILWYAFVLQSSANLRQVIQLQAEHISKDIDGQLKLRISALKHMAKHLERESPISDENWREISEYLLEYGGFDAVMWLDPNLNTVKLSTLKNSTPNSPYAAWVNSYASSIKNTARKNADAWLSPLLQNQPESTADIFAVVPVWDANHQLLGYLVSVIDLDNALELPLYHLDYAVSVYYDTHLIFENKAITPSNQIEPYITELTFYGQHWKVSVQPSKHFITTIASHLSTIALSLGISLAILFAIAARLALLARQRAKDLDLINVSLKNEIAERVLAEKSKEKMEKAMLQGQKLQAIGTLAGGIAHDFNNILYAIIGYTEMARDDVPKDSLLYNNLGKVLEGSHRGRDLIARILAFGRRQNHHDFHPLTLKPVMDSVLAFLTPAIPTTVTIHFTNDLPDNYKIVGNETQLHQVIVNLINNAVAAINEHGIINIQMSAVVANDDLLKQFPKIDSQEYCKIEITDTGDGISSDIIERIFEPFFTTKEVGQGSGLGLAIVHAIIEDHQGRVFVTSDLGKGTVFTILLPKYSPTTSIHGV